MLHELLPLDRPLIALDLETTGLADDARIVEIGFQVWGPAGLAKEWQSYVHPEMPIPPEATAIHGITDADVAGALTFRQLAPNLARGFTGCDFAGKNVRFDLGVLAAEMGRAGAEWSQAGARVLDADRLEQIAVPRSLSALHEKYTGRAHDGAHRALDDVRASVAVLCRQLEEHTEALPRDLGRLHALQWPGRVDTGGKFIVRGGAVVATFGKYRNQKIQDIPPDYWRFILAKDFSAEIKAIAAAALRGEYPEATQ